MRACLRQLRRYLSSCWCGVVDQSTGSPLPELSVHNPIERVRVHSVISHNNIAYDVGRIAAASTGLGVSVASGDVAGSILSGVNLAADVQRLGVHIEREMHR